LFSSSPSWLRKILEKYKLEDDSYIEESDLLDIVKNNNSLKIL